MDGFAMTGGTGFSRGGTGVSLICAAGAVMPARADSLRPAAACANSRRGEIAGTCTGAGAERYSSCGGNLSGDSLTDSTESSDSEWEIELDEMDLDSTGETDSGSIGEMDFGAMGEIDIFGAAAPAPFSAIGGRADDFAEAAYACRFESCAEAGAACDFEEEDFVDGDCFADDDGFAGWSCFDDGEDLACLPDGEDFATLPDDDFVILPEAVFALAARGADGWRMNGAGGTDFCRAGFMRDGGRGGGDSSSCEGSKSPESSAAEGPAGSSDISFGSSVLSSDASCSV